MSPLDERFVKLFALITHPNTGTDERAVAVTKLNELLDAHGISVDKVRPLTGAISKAYTLIDRCHALENRVKELEDQIAALHAAGLQAMPVRQDETPIDRVMRVFGPPKNGQWPYEAVKTVISMRRGKDHGWQACFLAAMQACDDEVSTEQMQQWRTSGLIPRDMVVKAATVPLPLTTGKGNQRWTEDEWDALKAHLGPAPRYDIPPTTTMAKIAKDLTERFGRTITENAIKGAVCNVLRNPTGKGRRGQTIIPESVNVARVH